MTEAQGSTEPILIVGSGALACFFAARLLGSGHEVRMLGAWPEGLAALRKDGVALQDDDGATQHFPVGASSRPRDFAGTQFALVLVKSWQTKRAANQLVECLASDGLAVTLQNGLGNRELLIEQLGEERVALGVTTTGATLLGPGRVKAGGEGTLSLEAHPRIPSLAEALKAAGFKVEMAEDVHSLAWSKLVVNAAINPLTAVLGLPNGELLARPSARALSAELALEVARVAEEKGISLTFGDPVAAAEEVARRTAANHSSMLQDLRRGAPTEIEAICGAVVRAGRESGVAAPLNDTMWKLVKAKVSPTMEAA